MAKVRLLVSYDGAGFHGFSENPGVRTVGSTMSTALMQILGDKPVLTCAGRTDRGVHARGQVVTFEADLAPDRCENLRHRLGKLCGEEIAIRSAEIVPDDFDARGSAIGRAYRYRILNTPIADPFVRHTTWHVRHAVDLDAMQEASQHFLGSHDFSSFCRRQIFNNENGVTIETARTRRVHRADWSRDGDLLVFAVEAGSFCQQMVRSLTGTLVDVGRGKFSPDDIPRILAAQDRHAAGLVAPPHGLTLHEVMYPPEP